MERTLFGVSHNISQSIYKNIDFISKYPEHSYISLLNALSEFHRKPINNFIVGAGANGILLSAISALIKSSDEMIMPMLSFPTPAMEANIRGAKVIAAPMRSDMQVDLNAIKNMIGQKTKLIYFCNPNNPTGLLLPADEIIDFAKSINIPVLISEANIEYSGGSILTKDDIPENIIIARSFSKAFGLAGMRVGYGFASSDNIKLISKNTSLNMVSVLSQAAAIAALNDRDFLLSNINIMNEERNYLQTEMTKLGFEVLESSANNILALVPTIFRSSTELVDSLALMGCSIVDGAKFPGLSKRTVRIVPKDRLVNMKFLELCERIIEDKE